MFSDCNHSFPNSLIPHHVWTTKIKRLHKFAEFVSSFYIKHSRGSCTRISNNSHFTHSTKRRFFNSPFGIGNPVPHAFYYISSYKTRSRIKIVIILSLLPFNWAHNLISLSNSSQSSLEQFVLTNLTPCAVLHTTKRIT